MRGFGAEPQKKGTTMTNRTVFTGAATAIITPLTPDGIDFER